MFEYLKQYCNNSSFNNSFYPARHDLIEELEKLLGCKIPDQLKIFYQEIGCGFLTHPHKYDDDYTFCNTNRINGPGLIIEMLEKGQESGYISEDVCEQLQPGDIPFFEIGDSSSFLKMKALSDNPNAVWATYESDTYKTKIADSLEEFIYRLYYEDTSYYEDIISANLEMDKMMDAQQ